MMDSRVNPKGTYCVDWGRKVSQKLTRQNGLMRYLQSTITTSFFSMNFGKEARSSSVANEDASSCAATLVARPSRPNARLFKSLMIEKKGKCTCAL